MEQTRNQYDISICLIMQSLNPWYKRVERISAQDSIIKVQIYTI